MHKKMPTIIMLLICLVFTGCDEETGEPEISVTDITPKNGYHYAIAEDCGDGCIYKPGSVMWYYDYQHKTSIPFCADPACKHEDKTCAAYLPGRVFGYKDKFVIARNEMKWEAETCVDDNIFVLEELLPDERTKRGIMRLDNRSWCDTYAYGDKLFIGIDEEYYLDGDYVYASSGRMRVYFTVVSLDTLEVEYMSDCLMDAFNADIHFLGENDGKLFFNITYYKENCLQIGSGVFEDIDPEQFTKHMVYDMETKEISELKDWIETFYLNGCMVYSDGKTTIFDRGDKVCKLTSDYELPHVPFTPLQYSNGKVYSDGYYVKAKEWVLLIFDTETEKLSSVKLPWSNSMKFVAERENEFLFANYGSYDAYGTLVGSTNIIALPKSEFTVSEMTCEQYNEFCKDGYDAYYAEEEENADAD